MGEWLFVIECGKVELFLLESSWRDRKTSVVSEKMSALKTEVSLERGGTLGVFNIFRGGLISHLLHLTTKPCIPAITSPLFEGNTH